MECAMSEYIQKMICFDQVNKGANVVILYRKICSFNFLVSDEIFKACTITGIPLRLDCFH